VGVQQINKMWKIQAGELYNSAAPALKHCILAIELTHIRTSVALDPTVNGYKPTQQTVTCTVVPCICQPFDLLVFF
jgi:hypothetical protein